MELSRFDPAMAGNEEGQRWKFVQGLRPDVRKYVLPLPTTTVSEAAEIAARYEGAGSEPRRPFGQGTGQRARSQGGPQPWHPYRQQGAPPQGSRPSFRSGPSGYYDTVSGTVPVPGD